ncbi:MAG: cellulase family glycosylhydrolase [Phycisphaerae bacterium]
MNRRTFLATAGLAAAAGATSLTSAARLRAAAAPSGRDLAKRLPRWRGFNLLEKFIKPRGNEPFRESDFEWMAGWGFDFVRLPMDYRCWTDADDPYRYDEKILKEIDQAVAYGETHGVHVSLNLHRAPGYTVARPPEKRNLWKDPEAQKQFNAQWAMFAKRYKGVPSARLSFNLVNEPAKMEPAVYARVARGAVAAIRAVDPDRLIVSDGTQWAHDPVWELADLGIAQSVHGYQPMPVTHYKASWVRGDRWSEPSWPLKQGDETRDRAWLREEYFAPWRKLAAGGVGVHMGEWGCYNKTPHAVVLAWMKDVGGLVKEAGWGWALWNFRGSFGILDSKRADVDYEDFHGHKLDRTMLDLLRRL